MAYFCGEKITEAHGTEQEQNQIHPLTGTEKEPENGKSIPGGRPQTGGRPAGAFPLPTTGRYEPMVRLERTGANGRH